MVLTDAIDFGNASLPTYFHRGQQYYWRLQPKHAVIICPRRYGKTHGIIAPTVLRNVHGLPGLATAYVSSSYKQAKTRTMPALFAALRMLGIYEGVHYVVGRKPDKSMGFAKPFVEPIDSADTVYWWNGHLTFIISQDVVGSSNSYTFYYVIGDEAKFLNYTKLQEETLPANGGSQQFAPKNFTWTHGTLFVSDQPTLKSGQWLFSYEKQFDKNLNDLILTKAIELERIYNLYAQRGCSKQHADQELSRLQHELHHLRKNFTLFYEGNPFDNVALLGEDYYANMKRILTPMTFQTAILNQRLRSQGDGFYSSLDETKHTYIAPSTSAIDKLSYTAINPLNHWTNDGDIDITKRLHIAFDYNSAINNVVVYQVNEREMRTLNWLYVKTPRKLQELVNAFCDYYDGYPIKEVVYAYDTTAIPKSAASNYTFKDIVCDTLNKRGWSVVEVYLGHPERHQVKHQAIDLAFKGIKYLMPTFNRHNCDILISAMQATAIKHGRNGFEKDKTSEAKPDSMDLPDELKTHGPDAWDTAFIQSNFFIAPTSGSKLFGARLG